MFERILSDMVPGESWIIKRITGGGAARKRLMDMGLVRGSQIMVVRTAPMGDPVEFTIKGYSLTLRKDDAQSVLVEVEGNER